MKKSESSDTNRDIQIDNDNYLNKIFIRLNNFGDNPQKYEYLLFTNKFNKDKKFQLFHSIKEDTPDDTIVFIFYLENRSPLSNIIINGNKSYLTYSKLKGNIQLINIMDIN